MKNEYQDADYGQKILEQKVKIHARHEKTLTPSGAFAEVRKHPHLQLIGDYILLWEVVQFFHKIKRTITRSQFWTMTQRSDEYKSLPKKEKMEWFTNLSI